MLPLRLNLGCGPVDQEGFLGIDICRLPNVQIVWDLEKGLPFLADNSVQEILASHVLEHIQRLTPLIQECWRVLAPGGTMEIWSPSLVDDQGVFRLDPFNDPEHLRYFTARTFSFYVKGTAEAVYQERRGYTQWFTALKQEVEKGNLHVILRKP